MPADLPDSWPVSIDPIGDGRTQIRYAYRSGKAANVVVPTSKHGEYDHELLASLVTSPPPPPRKPGTKDQREP